MNGRAGPSHKKAQLLGIVMADYDSQCCRSGWPDFLPTLP